MTRADDVLSKHGAHLRARLAEMGKHELDRVRNIALALPEVSEQLSHGAPCFFIRDKRALCYYHDNHRGDGRISLWCPAPPGVQADLVSNDPQRFFKPPASANGTFSQWLGVFLDTIGENIVDWNEITAILEDAYRTAAPTALVARLVTRKSSRPTRD